MFINRDKKSGHHPNKLQHVSITGSIGIGTIFRSMDTFVEQSTKTHAFDSNYSYFYSTRLQSTCIMIKIRNVSTQLL